MKELSLVILAFPFALILILPIFWVIDQIFNFLFYLIG